MRHRLCQHAERAHGEDRRVGDSGKRLLFAERDPSGSAASATLDAPLQLCSLQPYSGKMTSLPSHAIPPEIWLEVASYLHLYDIRPLARLCRVFADLATREAKRTVVISTLRIRFWTAREFEATIRKRIVQQRCANCCQRIHVFIPSLLSLVTLGGRPTPSASWSVSRPLYNHASTPPLGSDRD
jgi:hypothetical protein